MSSRTTISCFEDAKKLITNVTKMCPNASQYLGFGKDVNLNDVITNGISRLVVANNYYEDDISDGVLKYNLVVSPRPNQVDLRHAMRLIMYFHAHRFSKNLIEVVNGKGTCIANVRIDGARHRRRQDAELADVFYFTIVQRFDFLDF